MYHRWRNKCITIVTKLFPLTNLTKWTAEVPSCVYIWFCLFFFSFASKHQRHEWHQTTNTKKTCVIIIRQSSPKIIHVWLGGIRHFKVTWGCIIHGRVFPPLFTMRRAERAARDVQPYSHNACHLHTGLSRVSGPKKRKKKKLHLWWLSSEFAHLCSLCRANLRQLPKT